MSVFDARMRGLIQVVPEVGVHIIAQEGDLIEAGGIGERAIRPKTCL